MAITKDEFKSSLNNLVEAYINNFEYYGPEAQIVVMPGNGLVDLVRAGDVLEDLADSQEAVENAAAASRPETADAADAQVRLNPDHYDVRCFFTITGGQGIGAGSRGISDGNGMKRSLCTAAQGRGIG